MKKIAFCVVAIAAFVLNSYKCSAQDIIYTVAGCTSCTTTSVDGTPATAALFGSTAGVAMDAAGNIYIADKSTNKIRRIFATTDLVYTYAGTGSSGFSGDGGPASTASLNSPQGIFIDGSNNLYIADAGNNRIRKVDAATGMISTVAGGGSSTSDGVAATTASITPICVYIDATGNIYTGGSDKLRKINTAGIISTIAGNGTTTNTGDGGPALSAGIAGPITSITMDATGNIYIVPGSGDRVRKIDATTGNISTIAGGGTCAADGVLGTDAALNSVYSCIVDGVGNLIIGAVSSDTVIRQIDVASGIIHTIAGGGSSLADDIPALSASVSYYMLYMDIAGGNIYYSDSQSMVRKITYTPSIYPSIGCDSFSVSIVKKCTGPQISAFTNHYVTGASIRTWFGDGSTNTTSIAVACASLAGTALINHTYNYSGTYTIKQVLYHGTIAVDSTHFSYQQSSCNDFYIRFYLDSNNNCIKDTGEVLGIQPVITEVDSNNIPIDTISSTSGFYYSGYGAPGTTYQFKPFNIPSHGVSITCPGTMVISDTVKSLIYNTKTSDFGTFCDGGFDLSVYGIFNITGEQDQMGNIFVQNNYCEPTNATVTVSISPKYPHLTSGTSYYTPLILGNTVTWNIPSLRYDGKVLELNYEGQTNVPYTLTPGDTVQEHMSVTPTIGDANVSNNIEVVIDTVRAGCDPNEMWVKPSGCIPSGTQTLQYTINFENTGNDTAFNIYVMDTLSNNVDPKSMRLVMASAQMNTTVISTGGYNILKFDFPNINLLDSSHHGQCDGAVIYTINLKNSLPTGSTVFNHSGIFFDVNPVVMTNTVENIVGGCETAVPALACMGKAISIFPNPANETLTIKTTQDAYNNYTITNSMGQVLLQNELSGTATNVNVKTLAPGLYYITLKGESGTTVQKFVKME